MPDELTWTPDTARLDSLELWGRNPKRMSKTRAERLRNSWKDLKQYETLAVGPSGEVYNGHQRVKMLTAAGYPGDLEIYVLRSNRPLTDTERERVIIESTVGTVGALDFDALAGWDNTALQTFGLDAEALAEWNDAAANLREMLTAEGTTAVDAEPQMDRAEALQEKWQVAQNDVWQCGQHFIICGDCRDPETWARLLAASGVDKVNVVFTSPPYAEQRKEQYGGVPTGEYVEWWEAVQANVRANLAADGSFFVNIKPHCEDGERVLYVFDLVLAMKRLWGWRYVDELCWIGNQIPISADGRFKNGFEPVYHFATGKTKFNSDSVSTASSDIPVTSHRRYGKNGNVTIDSVSVRDGLARPSNVINAKGTEGIHAAAFPVALPAFFIKAYSDAGDVVLDPFLGSGTTIVAAHNEGRRGFGIEALQKYVAVTLERLVVAFGITPVRLG